MSSPSFPSATTSYTEERAEHLSHNLSHIRSRIQHRQALSSSSSTRPPCKLIAVSKYKPASDILACYEHGSQLDFGENYVQELVEKAAQLPQEIRWHFIGALQSNKAKVLAAIPNLDTIQTLTSTKAASALNKALPDSRTSTSSPLNVLIQINTSGESSKSGLSSLSPSEDNASDEDLTKLAKHIIEECPKLNLKGLMTIGSLEQSLGAESEENQDFKRLIQTRDVLDQWLQSAFPRKEGSARRWGDENGNLLLSMGMSSDYEAAVAAGSDIVRVGTGIFGERQLKHQQ